MTYSTTELCEATGLSFRQADYWCRTDVLWPISLGGAEPGSGYQREFSAREVQIAGALKALVDLGCKGPTLRIVAASLRWLTGMMFVDRNGGLFRDYCHVCWAIDLSVVLAQPKAEAK